MCCGTEGEHPKQLASSMVEQLMELELGIAYLSKRARSASVAERIHVGRWCWNRRC